MTTIADKETATDTPDVASRHAVLFNLEGIAGSERQATYDVLLSILGEQGVKIGPAHVSRFCLKGTPDQYMGSLIAGLHASRLSAAKLVEDVKSGIAMQLSSRSAGLPEHVKSLLVAVRECGVTLAALSGLPQATAESLLDCLGLNELGVQLLVIDHDREETFPRPDSWLKLSKYLKKSPHACTVISASQIETKSALSVGMRCIAVPDMFTAFEDFSGANMILDDVEDLRLDDVTTLVAPEEP